MEFRTPVTPDTSRRGLVAHGDKGIFLIGSCFAEEMAARLRRDLFDVEVNPTGTLYNPASILAAIERIQTGQPYTPADLFQGVDGLWHSFDHHSRFSRPAPDEAAEAINRRLDAGHDALQRAAVVFVSLGSAYVYERGGKIVANCHKMPSSCFSRRLITLHECAGVVKEIIAKLAPKPVVFTVSPIRHLADGLHGNTLSKATLHLAVEDAGGDSFPAFEALNDDLRDYRFYAADMKHPSDLAADYVYDIFGQTYMDDATRAILPRCRALSSLAAHKPLNPASEADHRRRVEDLLNNLSAELPCVAGAARRLITES